MNKRVSALKFALENEQNERDFYLANARRTKNLAGKNMFEKIKDEIACVEADINMAVKDNPSALYSAKQEFRRKAFFNDMERLGFDALTKKYYLDNSWVKYVKILQSVVSKYKNHKD